MFIGTFSSYNSSIVIFFVHFYFTEDMPAQIFFKFKSQLKFDSIPFDGLSISAKEVRRSIVAKKKMKIDESDLQLINAASNEGMYNCYIGRDYFLIKIF